MTSGGIYLYTCQDKFKTLTRIERIAPAPTAEPVPSPMDNSEYIRPSMVRVDPDIFKMGSDDGLVNAQPMHQVEISYPYMVGISQITFDEYACSNDIVEVAWFEK